MIVSKRTPGIRTAMLVIPFVIAVSASAKDTPPPRPDVTFFVSVTASCEYDVLGFPESMTLAMTPRDASASYPVALKFHEKISDADGATVFTYGGQANLPLGNYDARWPDGEFVVRLWYLEVPTRYYRDMTQCVRHERVEENGNPMKVVKLTLFPARPFMGILPETTTKSVDVGLRIPGSFEAPLAVCPDTGCR